MTVTAYVIEYLDGSFDYVPVKMLKGALYARRSKKPTCYKKVVLSRDDAKKQGLMSA